MALYELTFSFRYCGGVLWSLNETARKEYGYVVQLSRLPLSEATIETAEEMGREYITRLNWDAPSVQRPTWSRDKERDFKKRSRALYRQMAKELGDDYSVIYNNRGANARGFAAAVTEKGFRPETFNSDLLAMIAAVAPYFDRYIEGTNYDDYVYKGNHYRVVGGRNGQVIEFYPLDDYTPNFHPEKLKETALAAEPYDYNAPEIKMFDSKDPVIQARRQATFAREILTEHYGTDDMSKWV